MKAIQRFVARDRQWFRYADGARSLPSYHSFKPTFTCASDRHCQYEVVRSFCAEAVPTSSLSEPACFAVVDHRSEYNLSMQHEHGKQLSLAYEEGRKKEKRESTFYEFPDPPEDDDEVDDADDGKNNWNNDALQREVSEVSEEEEILEIGKQMAIYNNDGSLRRSASELIALRSGAPAGGKFAVVELDGTQHKVAVDDVIINSKLLPVETWRVGATLTLRGSQVLLVGSQDRTLVGLPSVAGSEVDVMVEEITHDKTVIVFKKKRRKHHRRKNGFRRQVTFLRVLDIRMPPEFTGETKE